MSILLVLIVNEMILKDIVMSNGYVHYLPLNPESPMRGHILMILLL